MPIDAGEVLERAYPCRTGCAAMGCAVAFLAALGCAAAFFMPYGWGKIQEGQGWEAVAGYLLFGVCAVLLPTILLAPVLLYLGIREMQRPEYLRATKTALMLPPRCRGLVLRDSSRLDSPPGHQQPAEIPYSAIRSIRREEGPGGAQLLIVHDHSPAVLVIQSLLLNIDDFNELEKILRAVVPAAFAVPPPAPPTDAAEET